MTNTFIPYTLSGISPITTVNTANFVKYSANTSNTDLTGFDLITAGTISAQNFAIPANNSNDESWISYTVSTMGNLSTIGGLITTDLTNGRSMYFTGGVIGAPNFQFATLGNGAKVVATDANGVMSTTIGVGQLNYITGLTSQAGGVGQQNTWTDIQFHTANVSTTGSAHFIQPYNALTADISTCVNRATLDSAIASLGAGILTLDNIWGYANTNNLNGGIKTLQNATQFNPSLDANSYFITGVFPTTYVFSTNWIVNPVSGPTANIALDPAVFYFDTNHKYVISFTGIFGTIAGWVGTVFNNSTSLTVSDASIAITTSSQNLSITFTAGSSNPTIYLRFVGTTGTLRWTNFTIKEVDVEIMGNLALSSQIDSNIVQSNGRTATLANGLKVNQTSLATAPNLTTASLPAGVSASTLSGAYTLTATAGGTTFGMWLGTSFTYIAGAKYTFTFTGFSTNATATEAMILYTNTYTGGVGTSIGDYIINVPITSSTVSGSFTATSNNNVVFNFVSSASGRSISFTGFTLTRADTEIGGVITATGISSGTPTTTIGLNASNQLIKFANAVDILPLNNIFTGTNQFNNGVQVAGGNLTCSLGVIAKQTATVGSLVQIAGGGSGNSPYLEFLFGGNSRGYIGNATATDLDLVAQNGAKLNFYTAGTKRLEIATSGDITANKEVLANGFIVNGGGTFTAGTIYSDPNWGMLFRARIPGVAGAFVWMNSVGTELMRLTDGRILTAGQASAPVIIGETAQGQIRWINPNGTVTHWGFPSGGGSDNYVRGTHSYLDCPVTFGQNIVNFNAGLPQNTSPYAQVGVFDGNVFKKSQAVNKLVYFNNNVAWGGGVNTTYAFYLYNTTCSVEIWGKNSGYYSGAGMMQTMVRVYSQSAGTYYYYPFNAFVNNGYNHFTVPLNYATTFPYTGWYDIYVYSTSGWITDTNDQLTIGVSILPVNAF